MTSDIHDGGGMPARRGRGIRALANVPVAIASTIAVTLGFAQPADATEPAPKRLAKAKSQRGQPTVAASAPAPAAAALPTEVIVAEGDTVSGIAARFGLATAEVLAANGLGWSSLIFPGQRLALPGSTGHAAPAPAAPIAKHVVAEGDTLSGIAAAYGHPLDALLSVNGLDRSSLIFPGQAVVLPGPATASAPPAASEAPTEPAPAAVTHRVAAGDTVWAIAEAHGVGVAQVLEANGLADDDLILPGRELVIPVVAVETVAAASADLTDEMRTNARIVVEVGRALGVPERGIVIALATAAQESGLRNLDHGDRDSLGLFQQRPSQGWGAPAELLDPVVAATRFFVGVDGADGPVALGLLDIPGWDALPLTEAAQAVQRSAHPDFYAKWEAPARTWLAELG